MCGIFLPGSADWQTHTPLVGLASREKLQLQIDTLKHWNASLTEVPDCSHVHGVVVVSMCTWIQCWRL